MGGSEENENSSLEQRLSSVESIYGVLNIKGITSKRGVLVGNGGGSLCWQFQSSRMSACFAFLCLIACASLNI